MASDDKKTSWWLWLSLALIIALFVAFILFLDRNIVKNAPQRPMSQGVEKNTGKPVFDFYTVLPQREVDIPDVEIKPDRENRAPVARQKPSKDERYIFQVGSYQAMSDADRQKAQLALLGLEARISRAKVAGNTFYRVEMGPYDARQYASVQKRLIENDVDFLPKKVR